MYYETLMHERRPVADAAEAAHLIHTRQVSDFDALVWTTADGRTIAAVGDNHCNNTWFEAAIIDLTNNIQIESITMGWIDTEEAKANSLRECETTDFRMGGPANLPIDGNNDALRVSFTCGCCGEWFKSTIQQQKRFDQDNGFGICPSCTTPFQRSMTNATTL